MSDLVDVGGLLDCFCVGKSLGAFAVPLEFMVLTSSARVLVEVGVRSDLVLHPNALHVDDLGSRELVGVLDGALADFLIENGLVDALCNGISLGRGLEMLIALISVLVSLDGTFVCSWVIDIVVTHGLRSTHLLLEHHQLHLCVLVHLILLFHFELLLTLRAGWVLSPKLVALVIVVRTRAVVHALVLQHGRHLRVFELPLLLVRLDGNVSIDGVVVFLLMSKH